jgi:hypothetical protein
MKIYWKIEMKTLLLIIILIHGLIHLLGFFKAFQIFEINQLNLSIEKLAGIFWLTAAVLFILSFVFLLLHNQSWWIIGLAAILLSQILIFQSWTDAKFGTIANLIILLPVIVSFLNILPSSFQNRYKTEVEKRLKNTSNISILSEQDIQSLPEPVKNYLQYAGAVGKPKIYNFRAVFNGEMKRSPESDWMKIISRQYNFFDDPARMFYIKSHLLGIPFDGLHLYAGNNATMQIKAASIFQAADAKGDEMTRGETVTLFNDMCLLAPSTLIDKNIKWEAVDSTTVKAKFTNKSNTISATLYFNKKGELINFLSNDRYLSSDGKTYTNYPWSTPVKDYKDFEGRKVAAYGEAVWHTPNGEYSYARFNLQKIDYNCKEFKY